MNKVHKAFNSLSKEDLKAIIRDLIALDETGVLPRGPARDLASSIAQTAGIPEKDALTLVQREPLRIAAFKWAQEEEEGPRERPSN